MIKRSKYLTNNKYIKIILLFFILLITYYQICNNLNYIQTIIFSILFLLLITNDFLRNTNERVINEWYYYSLDLSIILVAILSYLAPDLLIVGYYFFSKVNEIFYIKTKKKQLFLLLYCILLLIINFSAPDMEKLNIYERLIKTGISFFVFLSIIYMLYISHSIHIEKEETKKLNEKLKLSNIKLHEYSQKIEELSIARERERVAQEIHDSLGHSLMALIMHLEFAEKTFTSNPEKAQKVIMKARNIAKSSTSKLREAVTVLKEERNIESLRNSIDELIDKFSTLGDIKIDLIMKEDLESLNPSFKLCIYKTIRESLTNGIKHGKATLFKLKLFIEKNNLILIIKDNGVGCDKITMSNGLKGIENRIKNLGGYVDFNSYKNEGFLIKAKIPIYQKI
ncbi:sensor histidine kinase [Halocella sp. SP3-1]|nr:sensor histidine kinase [Halocella sp. SP3-1]